MPFPNNHFSSPSLQTKPVSPSTLKELLSYKPLSVPFESSSASPQQQTTTPTRFKTPEPVTRKPLNNASQQQSQTKTTVYTQYYFKYFVSVFLVICIVWWNVVTYTGDHGADNYGITFKGGESEESSCPHGAICSAGRLIACTTTDAPRVRRNGLLQFILSGGSLSEVTCEKQHGVGWWDGHGRSSSPLFEMIGGVLVAAGLAIGLMQTYKSGNDAEDDVKRIISASSKCVVDDSGQLVMIGESLPLVYKQVDAYCTVEMFENIIDKLLVMNGGVYIRTKLVMDGYTTECVVDVTKCY